MKRHFIHTQPTTTLQNLKKLNLKTLVFDYDKIHMNEIKNIINKTMCNVKLFDFIKKKKLNKMFEIKLVFLC